MNCLKVNTAIEVKWIFQLVFFLLGITYSHRCHAQSISNVDWSYIGSGIEIQYDLNDCRPDQYYNVKVHFESAGARESDQDYFKRGVSVRPKTLSGDLFRVSCGRRKSILWDISSDVQQLEGNYKAVVKLEKKRIWGRNAALASLFIPGLGDRLLINSGKAQRIKPWKITLAALGLLGAGIAARFEADRQYNLYLNDGSEAALSTYNNANNLHKASIGLCTLGGSIWLADIIHVFRKGKK
jgi:hypothetical protein